MGRASISLLAGLIIVVAGGCPTEVAEYDPTGLTAGSNSTGSENGDGSFGGSQTATAGATITSGTSVEPTGDAGGSIEPAAGDDAPQSTDPSDALDALRTEILNLVNAERAAAGAAPLRISAFLNNAAQDHAADMVDNSFFSHTGSNGSSVADRATAAGYDWSTIGENIAYGPSDPAVVMSMWMNSSGHRSNILNTQFEEIGIGIDLRGTPYWVQVFGRPR